MSPAEARRRGLARLQLVGCGVFFGLMAVLGRMLATGPIRFTPGQLSVVRFGVGAAASLAVFAIGIALLFEFDYDNTSTLQFVVDKNWIDVINSRYIMGLDGISLPLMALTLLVVPLCIIYSWNHFPEPKDPKAFLILILVLETGMIGSFLARRPLSVLSQVSSTRDRWFRTRVTQLFRSTFSNLGSGAASAWCTCPALWPTNPKSWSARGDPM